MSVYRHRLANYHNSGDAYAAGAEARPQTHKNVRIVIQAVLKRLFTPFLGDRKPFVIHLCGDGDTKTHRL
jgi:hypothetical protein